MGILTVTPYSFRHVAKLEKKIGEEKVAEINRAIKVLREDESKRDVMFSFFVERNGLEFALKLRRDSLLEMATMDEEDTD